MVSVSTQTPESNKPKVHITKRFSRSTQTERSTNTVTESVKTAKEFGHQQTKIEIDTKYENGFTSNYHLVNCTEFQTLGHFRT